MLVLYDDVVMVIAGSLVQKGGFVCFHRSGQPCKFPAGYADCQLCKWQACVQ